MGSPPYLHVIHATRVMPSARDGSGCVVNILGRTVLSAPAAPSSARAAALLCTRNSPASPSDSRRAVAKQRPVRRKHLGEVSSIPAVLWRSRASAVAGADHPALIHQHYTDTARAQQAAKGLRDMEPRSGAALGCADLGRPRRSGAMRWSGRARMIGAMA